MITIDRKYYEDCTIGRLTFDNGFEFQCFILELPWKDNLRNVSCIPEGTYNVFKRFSPGKQCLVFEYKNVPDRDYIQIHVGNFTRQIKGCQLPGDGVKWVDGDNIPDVTSSEKTLDQLMMYLPDQFSVTVKS